MLLEHFLRFRPVGELLTAAFSTYVGDDQPAREPDLLVVLNENRDRIQQTFLKGSADIAVEIVSPESIARDRVNKFEELRGGWCGRILVD